MSTSSQESAKFRFLGPKFGPKPTLKFVKVSERARAPIKSSPGAAGFDLCSAVDLKIEPNDKALISTDLKIRVPSGTYGRVAPRSGLAANFNVHVGAGVIDEDYRGPLIVVLFNLGEVPFLVKQGDRVAQLICEKIVCPGANIIKLFIVIFHDFY
jgi:dUTP pyrophosphatase